MNCQMSGSFWVEKLFVKASLQKQLPEKQSREQSTLLAMSKMWLLFPVEKSFYRNWLMFHWLDYKNNPEYVFVFHLEEIA